MKTLAYTLAIAVGAAVALYSFQARKTAAQKKQVASLQAQLQQQAQQTEADRAAQAKADQEQNDLLRLGTGSEAKLSASNSTERLAFEARPQLSTASAPDPREPAGPDQNGLDALFSKMLSDPEAKKFIRGQQRMMMDQMYAPLIKQMGLTPEDGDQFKDLLAETAMTGVEKAGSLFSGGSSNRTALLAQMAQDQKGVEEQLKSFLGEARFAQYQDYQQTVGERVQLNLYKQQMAGGENALTDQQTEQLLAIMKEEKQNETARTGRTLPGGTDQAENLQAMFSEDQANRLFEAQDAVNQRVYERASQVLSAEQLAGFARFQTNQIQMLRMGLGMARKMMSTEH